MADYKIVYLIIERGMEPNRQTFWRPAGNAYICRDGSLNLKLDIHPGLTFNIRDPKSNGERVEADDSVSVPSQFNGDAVVVYPLPKTSQNKHKIGGILR